MAVQVYVTFSPEQEATDAKGWIVTNWDDTIPAQVLSPTIVTHATWTAASLAIKAIFSADPSIDAYFQGTAEATVLAANASTVNSTRDASITAEGLTP